MNTARALTTAVNAPAARAAASAADAGNEAKETSVFSRIGLVLYLFFIISWFLQLGERYPALGSIRFDLLLVILISALCLLSSKDPSPHQQTWTSRRYVFWLVGYAVLTLPLIEWPGTVMKAGLPDFFKAAVFCLFTGTLVRTRRGLLSLLAVFVGCQIFRVLEPLYLHVTQGYWGSEATMANFESLERLAGAPDDIINPNGLAFVIVTTLTFCHFLCPLWKIARLAYLAYLPLALWALMLTGSRTGLLALGIVVTAIWLKSKRKMMVGAIVVVIIGVAIPLMPNDLQDRYESLFSSDTKNAGSASERTVALKSSLIVAARRPLFGHGLGTSGEANANFGISEQPAHNLWAEIAQELGFVGLLIFIGFVVTLTREVNRVRAVYRGSEVKDLVSSAADALQVFLVMNVLFSLASYGLSGYEWYLMAGVSDVLLRLSATAPSTDGVEALVGMSGQSPSVHWALEGVLSGSSRRLGTGRGA